LQLGSKQSNQMMGNLKDIPPLLHDARLTGCRWDRHSKTFDLSFRCLRRNVDGTPIENSTVNLELRGVEQIVADYSPASLTVKPSDFEPPFRITLAELEEWPEGSIEAQVVINSPQAEFDSATACVRETLIGGLDDSSAMSSLRVHVYFEPHGHVPESTAMGLSIHCDSLEPSTNGVPLDIDTWKRQFQAWWAGWRGHWTAKDKQSSNDELATEDTIIPAGHPTPPDLSYQPPKEAPFHVAKKMAPAELLKPIEDYHTGLHERDWPKVALAYPNFDFSLDDRAARLRDQYLGWDYGRWVYVRHIDGWWQEGDRACVVIRGIEHTMGDDEFPARNEETVLTYGLRRSLDGWVIAAWSLGWPRFGSAEKLAERQSWRDGWDLSE
jgi:hypothetical protein